MHLPIFTNNLLAVKQMVRGNLAQKLSLNIQFLEASLLLTRFIFIDLHKDKDTLSNYILFPSLFDHGEFFAILRFVKDKAQSYLQ